MSLRVEIPLKQGVVGITLAELTSGYTLGDTASAVFAIACADALGNFAETPRVRIPFDRLRDRAEYHRPLDAPESSEFSFGHTGS